MKGKAQAAIESPTAIARTRRGQAAMEFLMTYGWAILIMLVVIAVLFMLGVFNPQTASPNSCVLPSGFSCYGYAITDDGDLIMDIGQATGSDIEITGFACSGRDPADVLWYEAGVSMDEVTITSGKHKSLGTGLACEKDDGTFPDAGEFYRGTIYINYTDARTNIDHKITGDIGYKVESD